MLGSPRCCQWTEMGKSGGAKPTHRLLTAAAVGICSLAAAANAQDSARTVPFFPTAGVAQQGFVRVINHASVAGAIRIEAFDDAGQRQGPVSLSVDARGAAHFNSDDLAVGNAAKGLDGGIGRGQGDWRQRLTSALDIEVLAYIRTADGSLAAMHDTAPLVDGRYWVPIFNPGSNPDQVSRLRLVNPSNEPLEVSITGIDDDGRSGGGPVTVTLPAAAARTFTSAELESGAASGLRGALGDGAGKWQLFLDADGELVAMSLLLSPSGHLTNLSTVPEQAPATPGASLRSHPVWLFPAASDRSGRRGFVRLINRSEASGDVEIAAIDDDGRRYEPVPVSIGAGATVHFNGDDLEFGNADKGLPKGIGPTKAGLRLRLSSELDLAVLSYVRTGDGFVTAMHDTVVRGGDGYRVPVFNPGSNADQVSLLRLTNPGEDLAQVAIRGVDDRGDPSGTVRTTIGAGRTTTLSAAELETGTGVEGALGDGHGKWELLVESDRPLVVMSLLSSPTGHLTNLSTAPRGSVSVGEGVTWQLAENTEPGAAIGEPVTAAFRIEPTLDHALSGPDADAFAIDAETGQLTTRERATYDYEAQAEYSLTVIVTGGTGRAVRIAVTVEVGDEDEPPNQPSAPEVEGASTSGVRVSWTPPGNRGPEILDYDVEYRRDGTDEFTDVEHEGTATEAEVGSLSGGIDYEFRVRASNAEGVGEWSEPGRGRVTSVPPPPPPSPPSPPPSPPPPRPPPPGIPIFGSSGGFTVPENTVAVGTVRADNATTHSVANSADGAAFEIDNAGALHFRDAPDYERPTDVATSDPPDSARNNVYVVTVVATAGSGGSARSARQTVTVTVTDTPFEAPAVTTAAVLSSTEISLSWSPRDNAGPPIQDYDVQYRRVGTSRFADADHRGSSTSTTLTDLTPATPYEIQVRAVNANGPSPWSESIHATTNSNRAPEFAQSPMQRTLVENTLANRPVGAPLAATDPDPDSLTYRLGGRDAARFDFEATTAQLLTRTGIEYDHETRATLNLTVTAEDDHGGRATAEVEVAVSDESEPPGEVSRPAVTASTLDSLTINWTVPDNTGPLIHDYDYRYRRDTGGQNWTEITDTPITATRITIGSLQAQTRYAVAVRARNDEGEGGWSDDEYGTTANNQAPIFNEGASTTRRLAENTSGTYAIGQPVQAVDRDGGTLRYSLEGTAAGRFDIVEDTGQLRTQASEVYDHEDAARHQLTVRVADGQDGSATIVVTVAITDLREPPETPAAPVVSAESSTRLSANWRAPDTTGPAITDYDYRYGTDGVRWTTVANAVSTDTEVKIADLDPDTEYQVQVRATNDEGTSEWSESGRATTPANQSPTFAEGASATRALPENAAADTAFDAPVAANDANTDDTLTYRLGGTDAARFAIDPDSGQIRTRRFDYDHEERASYAVTVTAEDTQKATASIEVTIAVTDLDEAPSASAAPTRARSTSTTLTMHWPVPSNTGPDIDDYDYRFREMASGAPWDEVTNTAIDSPEVTIEDLTPDTTYEVEARAHNDEGTSPWSGTGMGKTNRNRAPAFDEGSRTTRSLPENTFGGVDIGDPVEATDPDDDSLTYTLAGTDAQSFFLDRSTGQLGTRGSVDYDHEAKSNYRVTVEVEDTWNATDSIPVSVNVADQLEPPAIPGRPVVFGTSPYSIEARWSAPANAGRPDITGYDVQYGIADSGNFSNWPQGLTGTVATITGLMPETAYEVQVLAHNAEGSSDWAPSGRGTTLVVVPLIDDVAFTSDAGADATYKLDDTIEVTVEFSEGVTVDTTGGEPKIDVVIGSTTHAARYDSISGSDELVFKYEVEDDVEDRGGVSIRANSLDTDGGTIRKTGRTLSANLAHAGVADDDDHKVDGVAPTLSSAIVNGSTLTLAYSETLASSPLPAAADFDVQVAGSSRTVSTVAIRTQYVILALASATAPDESITITYAGTGTNPIRDTAGNRAPAISSRSVDNETAGVCARTGAVRDAIARAAGVSACADVTATHLAQMTALDISSRRVATLKDGDFAELPALQRLTLEDNALTGLPADIFSELPSLVRLDLEDNNLSTLPSVFGDLSSLILLDLDGNQLSSIPSGVFSGLAALEALWIAGNEFSTLPTNAFADVATVTWIDLDDNDLADLAGDTFAGLSNLKRLWLRKNELSTLPDGLLSGLTALEELGLDGNAVDPLPIPVTLQLSGSLVQASIPVGAPFETFVPIRVNNGTLAGGVTGVTVSQGDTEGTTLGVARLTGTSGAVATDLGKLPEPPVYDKGYTLVRSDDLPLEVIAGVSGVVLRPSSLTVREGGSNGYTVALQARPSNTVSVTVTTATGLTALPSTITFTTDDWDLPQTVALTAATDADTTDNDVTVTHQADGGGYSLTRSLPVTIAETVADTNADPSFTSADAFTVAEHAASVGTVAATDGDTEDSVTGFTLGGADGDLFEITPDGAFAFAVPADFEKPEDGRSSNPVNHANNNQYVVAVTATSGVGSRRRTATQTITVTVEDLDEPPGQPPTPTLGGYSSTSILVRPGRRPIRNTGPEINDYDLQIRKQGMTFDEEDYDSPVLAALVAGLDPGTTYDVQVRARNDEGPGPWSLSGQTTTTDNSPPLLISGLPSGVTATAGGGALAFRLQGAFTDPDAEFLWLEASSRNPTVATVSMQGPAVVVQPLTAGQAIIAVTAHDPQGETVEGTFTVTVEAPTRADPTASIDATGDVLTLEFTDAFAVDERRSYEVRVRQKAPLSGSTTGCLSSRNTTGSAGDRDVSADISVDSVAEPGITYEVDYRYIGASCADSTAGGWSRVTEATAPGSSSFDIDVVVVGSASSTHRSALRSAADTWERILTTSLQDLDFSDEPILADDCMTGQAEVSDVVDDLRIFARLASIDGVGGTLAYAGPCFSRLDSGLPIISTITLDTDDLAVASSTRVRQVILHEMGHALGFGTRWHRFSVLRNPSLDRLANSVQPPPDTHFVGPLAVAAFDAAGGSAYTAGKVPVENTGGSGARDAHWRESVLDNEVMTPTNTRGRVQPLSAITIQSMADMGYGVDVSQAEAYRLPALAPRLLAQRAVTRHQSGNGFVAPSGDGAAEPVLGKCIVTRDSRTVDGSRRIVPTADDAVAVLFPDR